MGGSLFAMLIIALNNIEFHMVIELSICSIVSFQIDRIIVNGNRFQLFNLIQRNGVQWKPFSVHSWNDVSRHFVD